MLLLVSLVVSLVAVPEVPSLVDEACDPPLPPLELALPVVLLEPVVWVAVDVLELAAVVVPPLPPVPLVGALEVPPTGPVVVVAEVAPVDALDELADEAPVSVVPTLLPTGLSLEAVEHESTNVEQTILTVAHGNVTQRTFRM